MEAPAIWNGLDGLINDKPFMPGATPEQQANALIDFAERDGQRLGNGERRLIVDYANVIRDYHKVADLINELCEDGYEIQHGHVDASVQMRVEREIAEAPPILLDPEAEPLVTVIWSESADLRDGEQMPLSQADVVFKALDDAMKNEPGYDKTKFRIDFTMNGEADNYEGRQDFGDGDGWEFVSVYTDEGISATSTTKRDGFNKMVADALDGRIDLIITKSVSRFARNTVDSLTTIRRLKENKVECYFEKENIWTFDSKGELLLTIMSSLAQEESRSISENVTWGQRKRFADGKVTVPFKRFLGYDRGEDGNLVINEEQAAVVRRIYGMFLQGRSPFAIAKALTGEGIPTPGGKKNWSGSTVRSILTNEKYKGDALLQKVYTVDFLSKKKKVNEGEIPQYYVENNHDAIIELAVFEAVQKQMAVRQTGTNRQSSVGIFSSKIKCGDCGSWYGSEVWHSNDKYRRIIWQCNHKFDGGEKCSTPHLDEETIKGLFIKAVNILTTEKDEIAANFQAIKGQLFSTGELETEQSQLQEELNVVAELIQQCVSENAHVALDQAEYQARYNGLAERFDRTKARLNEVGNAITEKQAKKEQIERFLAELERQDGMATEFDEEQWYSLVDFVTVFNKEDIRFTFKDGTEIKV